MSLLEKIQKDRLPKHVAIIMDGNGRWAKQKGNSRVYGHKNGVRAVREAVEAAGSAGVEFLTLYAFSTENWNRPKKEIEALMLLLVNSIHKEINELHNKGVRLKMIGNTAQLPEKVCKELMSAIEFTANNKGLTLTLALSYSGRWDLKNAAIKMARDINSGVLLEENIQESTFSKYLSTAYMPDPELMIRTSGEFRISNFLLYELAYSELYFLDKFWPDFRNQDFYQAIIDYQQRERRFGKISEQIQ
ncbi:MAG: isoprenyl transferase [Bacteroidales bacterium]|nr:isoprenyl transferase [Bacteroidales bacterium]